MTTAALPDALVVLDVEASGLGELSWPIEVGVAVVEGDAVARSGSRLIRPDPSWDAAGWSGDSAAVHGISRAALDRAPAPADVARWLIDLVDGRPAVSDAPPFDRAWLSSLFAAANVRPDPIRLRDYDRALIEAFGTDEAGQAAIRAAWAHLAAAPTPHRAEADARRLANAYLAGRRALRDATGG